MGRSKGSCFKIITCGSDSVDRDDLEASETKALTDKRGWSFRKRSARHRVLSNTVISEVPSSVNKDNPESANTDFQTQPKSVISEKSSGAQWTHEMPQLSTSINSKFPDALAVAEVDTKLEFKPDESVIIIIQTAIRRFLAERELLKQKNIIKLQAAVRGHLERRHAVGSLRCVQAIIKMQSLVRARRARLSAEGSTVEEKLDEKPGKDDRTPKLPGTPKSRANPDVAFTSIEKLLNNRFASQLLESSPRTKSINIKCDPSRSDLAWKWLERWVAVSPTRIEQSHKVEPKKELPDHEKVKHPENEVDTVIPVEDDSQSTDFRSSTEVAAVSYLKPDTEEAAVPSESEDCHMVELALSETSDVLQSTENSGQLINQSGQSDSICQMDVVSLSGKVEQHLPENSDLSKSTENSGQLANESKQSDPLRQMEPVTLSGKPELKTEQQLKCSMKRVASEQPETEGRKFVFGSRKASNAAFIAAQSKFEELTSSTNSAKYSSQSNQENNEVESCTDTVSSVIDNAIKTREILIGGSECGTELSITSTLDSPDQSEVGAVEFDQEANISEELTGNPNNNIHRDVEAKVPTIPFLDLSNPTSVQSEQPENGNGVIDEMSENAIDVDSSKVEQKLEETSSDMLIELEHENVQVPKSSPEASPRSRITVQESQGTPSSQVSTESKKAKTVKNRSGQKRKSLSAGKKSPINPNTDSGVRSSLEQLPKDPKSGKRRNSFGSAKSDHVDQEQPRDSSSGPSIPSYMQATESAKAKVYANSSPRSSPDMQEKEIFIKKRHSLPGANGRQGSPRIQRSMSHAPQSTKGNGTNPPERKWQR